MMSPEELERKLEQSHKEVMRQIESPNYDPSWHTRKTISGKNYNGGKYDNPYAEDNIKKAAIFIGFCLVFLIGAM